MIGMQKKPRRLTAGQSDQPFPESKPSRKIVLQKIPAWQFQERILGFHQKQKAAPRGNGLLRLMEVEA
jgi:hypothetical protein